MGGDINNPPAGGFQKGGWYWDPSAGQARMFDGQSFGPPGQSLLDSNGNFKNQDQGSVLGGNQNSTEAAINKAIQDPYQELQTQLVQKFGDYTAGNPFRVDQVLADKTAQAKEQIDPYYNQMLGDYMQGVTNKINRSQQDTTNLLGQLSASADSYSTTSQNQLANATLNAQQSYANNGLLNSGDALRTQGGMQQQTNQGLADYMRGNQYQGQQANLANQRTAQDATIAGNQYTTQNAADRLTAENTQAGQLTKEAGQQYINGFNQSLPAGLQAANGFDMLKSLGIS